MKTKGITFWELHVEKLVLGAAALVFLAFLVLQVITNPTTVEVGGTEYTPRNVDEAVVEQARQLQAKISNEARSPVEDLAPPVRSAEMFRNRLLPTVTGELAVVQARVYPRPADVEQVDREFRVAELPATSQPVVRQYADALLPGTVEQFEELADVLPEPPEPPDIFFQTIAARLDYASILKELRKEDPDGEKLTVPQSWYGETLPIVDVVVERQEQANGGWTNTTLLSPIPGQYTYRPEIESEDEPINATRRDAILLELAQPNAQQMLAQPPFYPTLSNAWIHPFSAQFEPAQEEDTEIGRLLRRVTLAQEELQALEKRMRDAGVSLDPDEDDDERNGGGGSPGGPDPSGGPGAPDPTGGSGAGSMSGPGGTAGDQIDERLAERWRRDRRTLLERIRNWERELETLGYSAEPPPARTLNLSEDDEIDLWVHDIAAEPEATYRYRMKVRLYNPFFARRLNLVEEQQQLAGEFTMDTPWSEWSDPVHIQPRRVIYIVNASPAGRAAIGGGVRSLGSVDAEVYRFYNGRWWYEEFRLQPGDRIGTEPSRRRSSNEPDIDFITDWFVVDCIEDIERPDTAWVVRQNIESGEVSELIDPDRQRQDPQRQRLRRLSDLARQQAAASSSDDSPSS